MGNSLEKAEDILTNIETSHIKKIIKKIKPIIKYHHHDHHQNTDKPLLKASNLDEINRSKLQHIYYRYIWNSNFSSPVERILHSGANVIDLGCCSGNWLIDLSTEYPNSHFIGIDHKDIFQSENVPENLRFIKRNILNGIPYENNTFDFIHMRFMINCFSEAEWRTIVLPEIFRVCKPGGWIEIMDLDLHLYNVGPKTGAYHRKYNKINMDQLQDIMNIYQDLGITIIKEKINAWYPIKLQNSNEPFEMASEFISSYYPLMSKALKLNQENYTKLSRQILEEIARNKTYGKTYRMITQKHL